mmetsp:Transcript_107660/g.246524  ORF Transcript_107660/g.246524 Transcript_107660/m.246524 type:complete len:570 (+) Transcript_107660:149-1858(+)
MPSSQSARGTEGSSHRFAFNPLRKPMRSSVYSMISFLQAFNMTGFQFSWVSSDRALTEPFLADLNMDGRPDLVANTDGGRSVWNNTGSKFDMIPWVSFVSGDRQAPYAGYPFPLASPHSSAFVDVDGDCKSDLAFVVMNETQLSLEIWLSEGSAKSTGFDFRYSSVFILPNNGSQVTWTDMNADGALDIVVPVCNKLQSGLSWTCSSEPGDSQILVLLNQQKPMCESKWTSSSANCRRQSNLCVASDFSFAGPSDWKFQTLPQPAGVGNWTLKGDSANPPTFRSTDYNSDTFPDLLALVESDGGVQLHLYHSCSPGSQCSASDDTAPDVVRQFVCNAGNTFDADFNISVGAFFDATGGVGGRTAAQSGGLSIIAFGNTASASTAAVLDTSDFQDHFHIVATGLNGVCMENCDGVTPNPRPIGVNTVGVNFKITVTTFSGDKRALQAQQLPQSAYQPLQLPFVYFGLSRSNNYIEEFYIGLTVSSHDHSHMFSPIIPNTAVLVIPYPREQPESWKIELAISRTSYIFWVAVAAVGCMALNTLILLYLDRRERHEEEKTQHQNFRIHFMNT